LFSIDGRFPKLFGLGLGLLLSFAATRIYESMLSGTKPLDPVVLSGVVATLETSCDPGSYGQ
jgi:putative ABC transport system permease protein